MAKLLDLKPIRQYINEKYDTVVVYEGTLIDDLKSKFFITIYETLEDDNFKHEIEYQAITLSSSFSLPFILFHSSYKHFILAELS